MKQLLSGILLFLYFVMLELVLFVAYCPKANADTFEFTPYASLGVGKMLSFTDEDIRADGRMGSHTPGYIEAGLIIEPLQQPLWVRAITFCADEIDVGWRHQSYLNRGTIIVYEFGGNESYIDAVAVNFIWKFQSLSWKW